MAHGSPGPVALDPLGSMGATGRQGFRDDRQGWTRFHAWVLKDPQLRPVRQGVPRYMMADGRALLKRLILDC